MGNSLRLICVIVILFGFKLNSKANSKLKIRINGIEIINIDTAKDPKYIKYIVDFQMWNNSNSEVRYWTMTCSWEDIWIFDSDKIGFTDKECDHNVPALTQILPGQIQFFSSKISYHGNINDTANIQFRIGFVLVKRKELKDFLDIFGFYDILSKKRKTHKDIIWSEPFRLKETPKIKLIKKDLIIPDDNE